MIKVYSFDKRLMEKERQQGIPVRHIKKEQMKMRLREP